MLGFFLHREGLALLQEADDRLLCIYIVASGNCRANIPRIAIRIARFSCARKKPGKKSCASSVPHQPSKMATLAAIREHDVNKRLVKLPVVK